MKKTNDLFYQWLESASIIENEQRKISSKKKEINSFRQSNSSLLSSHDIDFINNEEIKNDQLEQQNLHRINERKEIELELINRVNLTAAKSIIITPQSAKGANTKTYIDNGNLMFHDTE